MTKVQLNQIKATFADQVFHNPSILSSPHSKEALLCYCLILNQLNDQKEKFNGSDLNFSKMQEEGVFSVTFHNQSLTKKLVLKGIYLEESNSITLSLLKSFGSQEISIAEIKLDAKDVNEFIINNSSAIYSKLTKQYIEREEQQMSPDIRLSPRPIQYPTRLVE